MFSINYYIMREHEKYESFHHHNKVRDIMKWMMIDVE